MVIIKHGTAYEKLSSHFCICPKCNCEFEYVKRDIHEYLNEECYVICPECFSDIKLSSESEEQMTFSEKNCNTCGQKCAIKYYGCSNWIPMQSKWTPYKPQEREK